MAPYKVLIKKLKKKTGIPPSCVVLDMKKVTIEVILTVVVGSKRPRKPPFATFGTCARTSRSLTFPYAQAAITVQPASVGINIFPFQRGLYKRLFLTGLLYTFLLDC